MAFVVRLERDEVAGFARRMAGAEKGSEEWEAVRGEFLEYAAGFLEQFSGHYGDFLPRPDGLIDCTMQSYTTRHQRIPYVVDPESGFIRPQGKDVERGGKYKGLFVNTNT